VTASPALDSSSHGRSYGSCHIEAEVVGKQNPALDPPSPTSNFSTSNILTPTTVPPIGAMSLPLSLPLVAIDSTGSDTWRASVAVGGMTCASCAGTITEELERKDWIRKVVINLLSNSATIDFEGAQHKNDIVESIEDIGFEATLDNVVDLTELEKGSQERTIHRTVDILVQGMFCDSCPSKVGEALEAFAGRVKIEKAPTIRDPVMTIRYTPQVCYFQSLPSADIARLSWTSTHPHPFLNVLGGLEHSRVPQLSIIFPMSHMPRYNRCSCLAILTRGLGPTFYN
jgi:Cu+-exporting ATPase